MRKRALDVYSPVVNGSGAIVVHRALGEMLDGYQVEGLSPYWGVMPLALKFRQWPNAGIVHSLPELGPWVAGSDATLVVTFHNYYLDDSLMAVASRVQRRFYRHVMRPSLWASLRRARYVTAVSRFTADLVERHHGLGERLTMIPNGVDTSLFRPIERDFGNTVNVLFAGNPTRRKGADHLSSLAAALPEGVTMQYTAGLRDSGHENHISGNKKMV